MKRSPRCARRSVDVSGRERLIHLVAGLSVAMVVAVGGAEEAPDRQRLEALARTEVVESFDLLHELLSIPNDAQLGEPHLRPNLAWMTEAFEARGFATRELETAGFPLLLAERAGDAGAATVLVYLQIDGQPVDPSRWHQQGAWKPVLKEHSGAEWGEIPWARLSGEIDLDWRVFARSASDAKGPVAAFLRALDIFAAEGLEQAFNLKIIMDFEEELGSPNLPAAVDRHREALDADMLVIFDGPRHYSNRPSLTFGARGIATIELKVFGPRAPQHSGHFGNYAPNPALRLARLLASMKDDQGRVVIPGYYDGVEMDDQTREILSLVPDDDAEIRRGLGVATVDQVAPNYQESIQYPSLNIRGMASGWVGSQVRTIVPSFAVAEIDVRLTPETDAEELIGMIRDHVTGQGYHLVDSEPTEEERATHALLASFEDEVSYAAFRTPFDSRVGRWLVNALERSFGEKPVRKRMSGGSIPISPFVATLGIPAVILPIVNSDNNQHSPNENLRVGNYLEGIQSFLAVLTEPIPE
jgi:acetylornithine deacetylase/succinyl-diaminopimelate desuccinylase-like protein